MHVTVLQATMSTGSAAFRFAMKDELMDRVGPGANVGENMLANAAITIYEE